MQFSYLLLNEYDGIYESYHSTEELDCGLMYVIDRVLYTVVDLTDVNRHHD